MTYTSLVDCETACTSRSTCAGFEVASGNCYMKSSAVNDGSQSSCTGSNIPFYVNTAQLCVDSLTGASGAPCGSDSTAICCSSGTTCVLAANNYNTVNACLSSGQTACGGYLTSSLHLLSVIVPHLIFASLLTSAGSKPVCTNSGSSSGSTSCTVTTPKACGSGNGAV